MVTLISAALKEGKLDTDMPVCSIRENKEKILVIIVRYLKRTGRGSTPVSGPSKLNICKPTDS
jgi:hypothetical protein